MKQAFGDFSQSVLHTNNKNNIDMVFTCKLDLSAFTGMTASKNLEEYKNKCDEKGRIITMYFLKALTAYQACEKMYNILSAGQTLYYKRIDSEILTSKNISTYINETFTSLFDSLVAIEFISSDENIFFKIINNSTTDFVQKMTYISNETGVVLHGV